MREDLPLARTTKARTDAQTIATAVNTYRVTCGALPESIEALVTQTTVGGAPCGPVLGSIPAPPTGWSPYVYARQGDSSPSPRAETGSPSPRPRRPHDRGDPSSFRGRRGGGARRGSPRRAAAPRRRSPPARRTRSCSRTWSRPTASWSDQGVLDGYGHVSARHDRDAGRFLMSRSLAPRAGDRGRRARVRSRQRAGRGGRTDELPRAVHPRRDLSARARRARDRPQSLALGDPVRVTGAPLRPLYHMSAFLAGGVPVWDIHDRGGRLRHAGPHPALGDPSPRPSARARWC